MQDLRQQEIFELEVLEKLNSKRLLNNLVFGGGTMLRLCFGLDRYSVDLDFWVIKNIDFKSLYDKLIKCFSEYYTITDSQNKFYTILFELKSPDYPRLLKIEIRKELKKVKVESAIAYSNHSIIQVLVKHVSLADMMNSKVQAFLNRKEIRDVFDIEFLFKRGVLIDTDKQTIADLIDGIKNLSKNDYSVKLGSVLEAVKRKYYKENNFDILLAYLKEKTV